MSNAHVIHGSTGGYGFGTLPTTKTAWTAGALAVLYAFGVAQYFAPFKFIGLGVPTVVGLLAGAFGLFAITRGGDHSWVAWLGITAGVVGLVLTVALV